MDSYAYSASAGPPSPENLHARCARKIGRHIGRVLGPDTEHEDLVQEVLMTVFDKLGTLRNPACFDAWVAQVTVNTLRQKMRQRRLHRQALGVWLELGNGTVETNVEARYVADRALRVLERLSPSEGALLVAQWFTPGKADALAAKAERCSLSTAQRRLKRARVRFENLARRDPALAPLFDEAKPSSG
ncbi:MAG TPA: sigma-70 family RNA polymerase sigma factor [Polyangiaceae bacterium]